MALNVPFNTTQPQRLYQGQPARYYFSVFNTGNGTLYLDRDASVGVSNNYIPIAANAYYESPHALDPQEDVWGIWASGTTSGAALIRWWAADVFV